MTTVKAYASPSSTEDLIPTTIERREVGPHDVLIDIKFAGICHSDIHTVRGAWGPQQYPLVPGHEIAGVVTQVGSEVTRHVVGLGGLGHMGVKIAHAMGAEVTVLSQSLKKQEDGLKLGADHYYATSDESTFSDLAGTFDLIINTVSASIDISSYLQLLKLDGALVNVGAPAEPLPVNAFALIGGRRSFAGSMIGGIRETQEMLDFCAEHGIGAEIEVIPAEKINEAYERVLASDVRYRFVIDTSTL